MLEGVDITGKRTASSYRHSGYDCACDHAREMSVHLYGDKPAELLNITRPREDPETTKYRLDSYQATTKSTAAKAVSILSKIFNPSIFSIKWKDQSNDGKSLENYTLQEFPEFNSVVNFLSESALKKMLADPNGMIAVRPRKMKIKSTERVQPIIKVYGSPNIWYFDDEFTLFFLECRDVREEGQVRQKFYFEYYDDTFIIRFNCYKLTALEQVRIEEEERYEHGCEEAPVWQLRGIPELRDDGGIIFKSFFDGALPHWNLAVIHQSDLFGALINHMHPIRVELAEECDYRMDGQACRNGMIAITTDGVATGGTKICPGCNGTGHRSVRSPYGVYQYNKDKLQEGTGVSLQPVDFINVPTDATKLLKDIVKEEHESGLNAINMDIVNKVGENQSGKAKVIDRGELYDFLYQIANVIFDIHLNNIYYYFNILMFKPSIQSKPNDPTKPDQLDGNLPSINKPMQFDITSAMELINQMEVTKTAGLSPAFIRHSTKEIIAKKFASNPDAKLRMDLIVDLDPLPDYAVADIVTLQGGLQKPWPIEWVVTHFNMENFVERALSDNEEKFLAMSDEEKKEVLYGFAKEIIATNKLTLNVTGVQQGDSQQQTTQTTEPVTDDVTE